MPHYAKITVLVVFSLTILMSAGIFFSQPALASSDLGNTILNEHQQFQNEVGVLTPERDLPDIIVMLIKSILGLLGLVFVVLILQGGFQWMTAGGNEASIKSAKNRLKNAIIGLLIIIAAYSITLFVINALKKSTGAQYQSSSCQSNDDCPSGFRCSEALHTCVIKL
ncbi:MAG: hypothetical protein ACKKL5_04050 [Candidatus Komeilibacteria bacterium]